jgi:rare lipoprotein A
MRWLSRILGLLVLSATLAACGTTGGDEAGDTRAGGVYKVGQPYEVNGNWYYPQEDPLYDETGIASWYGAQFQGRRTANGEIFDRKLVTAAHKTLPMPSTVRVTNLENGRSLVARVNDRGPFKPGRIIDMSEQASELLGFKAKGMTRVRVQFIGIADLLEGKPGQRVAGKGSHAGLGEDKGADRVADAAPTSRVQADALPPPPGAVAAPQPRPAPREAAPVPVPVSSPIDDPIGEVIKVAVQNRGRLFVQAGSFIDKGNAQRLLARLRPIAEFRISSKTQDGKVFHRVRAGPLKDVDEADAILDRVLLDGQKGASIVVE